MVLQWRADVRSKRRQPQSRKEYAGYGFLLLIMMGWQYACPSVFKAAKQVTFGARHYAYIKGPKASLSRMTMRRCVGWRMSRE